MDQRPQKIIWPWDTNRWVEIKTKFLCEIRSIVDMDGKISSMYIGKISSRQITELFATYHREDQYKTDRISEEHFLKNILPVLQKLVELAPKTFKDFDSRVLPPGYDGNIALNRVQVATIIACMWFGLFKNNYLAKGPYKLQSFPLVSFANIFLHQNVFALQCLLTYFNRVCTMMQDPDINTRQFFEAGVIVIKRNVLVIAPVWEKADVHVCEIFIDPEPEIDLPLPKMTVAYAHEYIGGGDIFRGPLSQEEIVLLTRPECLVSLLFCAVMEDHETITVIGAECMSAYTGFGSSVRFAGAFVDPTPIGYSADETEVAVQTAVIFMDATIKTAAADQMNHEFIRDLNKAYCGFNSLRFNNSNVWISTGNWSFGFNGTNIPVKFIQQVLAASLANKHLIYKPITQEFAGPVREFTEWLKNARMTAADLFIRYLTVMDEYLGEPGIRLSDVDVFADIMGYQ